MKYEIVDLDGEQLADIEERLERYDRKHAGLKHTGNISIGILSDGELIAGADGCMTVYRIFYVSTIFVDERHRKCGIGRKLLESLEQRALAMGANLIRLDTFDWQGVEFYKKCGYEQVGCYTHKADGFSEYFLIKRI